MRDPAPIIDTIFQKVPQCTQATREVTSRASRTGLFHPFDMQTSEADKLQTYAQFPGNWADLDVHSILSGSCTHAGFGRVRITVTHQLVCTFRAWHNPVPFIFHQIFLNMACLASVLFRSPRFTLSSFHNVGFHSCHPHLDFQLSFISALASLRHSLSAAQ